MGILWFEFDENEMIRIDVVKRQNLESKNKNIFSFDYILFIETKRKPDLP